MKKTGIARSGLCRWQGSGGCLTKGQESEANAHIKSEAVVKETFWLDNGALVGDAQVHIGENAYPQTSTDRDLSDSV
jgi:hypothetical protein